MQHGFITVASAVPSVRVADTEYNILQIETLTAQAEGQGVEIIAFPELSVTGYTCQDLFAQQLLIDKAEEAVMKFLEFTRMLDIIAIVGAPVAVGSALLNCAIVVQRGQIIGIVPKTYLPNYGEFYEQRWFTSASDICQTEFRYAGNKVSIGPMPQLFQTSDGALFGIELCEDLWAPIPPSDRMALCGAEIVVNLSASDELVGKHDYLRSLLSSQSARLICGYIYSSAGFGESTQDVVYAGNALIYENGQLISEAERFATEARMTINQIDLARLRSERRHNTTFVACRKRNAVESRLTHCLDRSERPFRLLRTVNPHPFIPMEADRDKVCGEILSIQAEGLAKRMAHTGMKRAVIGISGGLDSTLALIVCVKAFDLLSLDRHGIVGVTMPGFGTTRRTHDNAVSLMDSLGVTSREINIEKSVSQHFADIGHDPTIHDVTYENSQARERTQILMDLSNKLGALVVGTGDMSELALGWATYNGDHMSMYAVNVGVPKTLVSYLVSHAAEKEVDEQSRRTLMDILDTPISPELLPATDAGEIKQKTEDLVGPYELHDFFLYYFLRFGFRPSKIYFLACAAFSEENYSDETIKKWLWVFLRRFFAQQFKRSCLPDGPKVGSVSLSPRGDWRMPSDASAAIWLKECDEL